MGRKDQDHRGDYPIFLTATQASIVSGIGENRLRELMDRHLLEYLPVGNRRLITVEALMAYYQRAKIPVK